MPVTYDLDGQKRVYATWAKFYDRIYQNMLARPQREAVEAWLRRVPDTPGDWLRQKFWIEYPRRRMGEEP